MSGVMGEPSACVVLTTAGSPEEAGKLARVLVESRLAACVQRLPITSVYSWQGNVHEDPEVLLLIKTARRLYPQVEAAIRENHSYDTPEIILLPVQEGLAAYLKWIEESTGAGGRA